MNIDEGDGDLSDVAMPGFIDILSSVITVFMFFMLITSAIMFFMSLAMKKSLVDESRKQTESKVSQEVQEYVHKVETGEITLKDLTAKLEQIKEGQPATPTPTTVSPASASADVQTDNAQQGRATFSKGGNQTVSMGSNSGEMVIVFADKGIAVSQDTTKSLASFVEGIKANAKGKPVSIELEVPDNPDATTLSVAREIGLGRMLNVRNVLLTNKLAASNISIHNVPAQSYGTSYDWVRVHVRQ